MNTQTTEYDAPAVYLPALIDWAEMCAKNCAEVAVEQAWRGNPSIAESYVARGLDYSEAAHRARTRLVDISELTLADVQAGVTAPPRDLPGLVTWLRAQLERWFPALPVQGWQAIAWVLHEHGRPR